MLYKVGDKVKIKKREELEKCGIAIEGMLPYAEQLAIITFVTNDYEYYNISNDEGMFAWDDECFCERALPENVKETIIEKASETRQLLEKFDTLLCEFQELRDRLYDLERKK